MQSKRYYIFLVLFLAGLSAFGPFVTDMYLPTLPSMTQIFDTTESMVQLGLTTALVGLARGQVFFGPISEKYGRKLVIVSSMALFSIAAVACVFAKDIEFFLVCRFFQGIGGSGGIVMSRSVCTDCYKGRELAKMMSIVGAINGIAPVVAPVTGGLLSGTVGWRGIFMVLLAIGLVLLLMSMAFRESLPTDRRSTASLLSTFGGYAKVLRVRRFVLPMIANAAASGVLFSYISSSSFVIQENYGYSELMFSVFFAVNSVAIALGAAMALRFPTLRHSMLAGALGLLALALTQMAIAWCKAPFVAYECATWLMLLFLGLVFTSASTLAMDAGRVSIGAASALVGSLGFLIGGVVSPLVGMGDIMTTTALLLIASSLVVFFSALAYYRNLAGEDMI